ncbi:MAG: ribonuclease P protein component [Lysobacter sp.]|nr:ribonuclease P protein component [Lysobacter sp.]
MNAAPLPPARARFPRTARVRSRGEYGRVFEQGRRHQHPLLSLHVLPDDRPARLGLAVSRKVDTRAVARNRIKRVLRDRFRRLREQLPQGAYVLVARPAAARAGSAELTQAFEQLLLRAGALPCPAPAGTMPAPEAPSAPAPPSPSIQPPRCAGRAPLSE